LGGGEREKKRVPPEGGKELAKEAKVYVQTKKEVKKCP
jgi:hypothetical protein